LARRKKKIEEKKCKGTGKKKENEGHSDTRCWGRRESGRASFLDRLDDAIVGDKVRVGGAGGKGGRNNLKREMALISNWGELNFERCPEDLYVWD